jgi:hypothetical protein
VAHEHRWSAWRQVGVAFAYDGTEVGTSIVEVNGDPVTLGWSRRCACGDVETNAARAAAAPASGPRETTVDQLTAKDFGLWVDVPERETAGHLYVISDQYGDGYPSRVLTLVAADGSSAAELEFTDADPASYPKTMRTPCALLAEQPGGGR